MADRVNPPSGMSDKQRVCELAEKLLLVTMSAEPKLLMTVTPSGVSQTMFDLAEAFVKRRTETFNQSA